MTLAPPLSHDALQTVERDLHLRYNKWDTQVGDTSVLSAQPVAMTGPEWDLLCCSAEQLAKETKRLDSGDKISANRSTS